MLILAVDPVFAMAPLLTAGTCGAVRSVCDRLSISSYFIIFVADEEEAAESPAI
jgi:hypothetical protein